MRKSKNYFLISAKVLLLYIFVAFIQATTITTVTANADNKWEDDDVSIICPQECACKYQHFDDLSVASWIQGVGRPIEEKTSPNGADSQQTEVNGPMLKAATCYLRQGMDSKDFFSSLPMDLQVLVLLHLGTSSGNATIETSHISILSDLETLELRGGLNSNLNLVFNEPLTNLKNLNLEAINLLGIEHAKRRPNFETYNPSDHFDYVPESEKVEYNVSITIETEDIEVVPYEVYLMEKKKAQTVSFYGFDNLEILRIHECKLDELYWEIFDGLEALQHLSLEHNEIKVIPPFAFFGALHIKTLSLAKNSILDLNYRALAGLLELEQLDLSYNNLTKISELTFAPFPKLETLDLRFNPIKYIFPETFGVMNGTKTLFMGTENQALDLNNFDSFEHLVQLQTLIITNATTEEIATNTFKGLNSLRKLSVRGTLKRVEFDSFADKPNLIELSLRDCEISDISMDTLFGIHHLEIVDLANNYLTSIPHGLFDEQSQLREIYLENNQLTELPHNFFTLQALKLVRLTGNPWKCTCEMVTWKQGLTNAVKIQKPPKTKCELNEALKQIICETMEGKVEYTFDNKFSPRCNDTGRSVFYSLRKDLRCNTKKHRETEALKHQKKKQRIAEKSAKYYADRISNLRWENAPPTQGQYEVYDFSKNKRQKEMTKNFNLKVFNTVMRENELPKPEYKKFKRVDNPENNLIMSNSYEF